MNERNDLCQQLPEASCSLNVKPAAGMAIYVKHSKKNS